jgi:hypothetical protein
MNCQDKHPSVATEREGGLRHVGQRTGGTAVLQAANLEQRLEKKHRSRPVAPCRHCAWVESELYCQFYCQVCPGHVHLRHAVFRGVHE